MALALASASAAFAGDEPTASEITDAVSDHTYQGAMSQPDSGFAEYYAPDGEIRGDGYAGQWRTEDGAMCFQYGDKPESCFEVAITGPSMVMYKDGEIDGNGMLIPGNPNGF
ncbi:MAG: hypothetical protein ACLFPA_06950 [Dichotomicrobium sp.]